MFPILNDQCLLPGVNFLLKDTDIESAASDADHKDTYLDFINNTFNLPAQQPKISLRDIEFVIENFDCILARTKEVPKSLSFLNVKQPSKQIKVADLNILKNQIVYDSNKIQDNNFVNNYQDLINEHIKKQDFHQSVIFAMQYFAKCGVAQQRFEQVEFITRRLKYNFDIIRQADDKQAGYQSELLYYLQALCMQQAQSATLHQIKIINTISDVSYQLAQNDQQKEFVEAVRNISLLHQVQQQEAQESETSVLKLLQIVRNIISSLLQQFPDLIQFSENNSIICNFNQLSIALNLQKQLKIYEQMQSLCIQINTLILCVCTLASIQAGLTPLSQEHDLTYSQIKSITILNIDSQQQIQQAYSSQCKFNLLFLQQNLNSFIIEFRQHVPHFYFSKLFIASSANLQLSSHIGSLMKIKNNQKNINVKSSDIIILQSSFEILVEIFLVFIEQDKIGLYAQEFLNEIFAKCVITNVQNLPQNQVLNQLKQHLINYIVRASSSNKCTHWANMNSILSQQYFQIGDWYNGVIKQIENLIQLRKCNKQQQQIQMSIEIGKNLYRYGEYSYAQDFLCYACEILQQGTVYCDERKISNKQKPMLNQNESQDEFYKTIQNLHFNEQVRSSFSSSSEYSDISESSSSSNASVNLNEQVYQIYDLRIEYYISIKEYKSASKLINELCDVPDIKQLFRTKLQIYKCQILLQHSAEACKRHENDTFQQLYLQVMEFCEEVNLQPDVQDVVFDAFIIIIRFYLLIGKIAEAYIACISLHLLVQQSILLRLNNNFLKISEDMLLQIIKQQLESAQFSLTVKAEYPKMCLFIAQQLCQIQSVSEVDEKYMLLAKISKCDKNNRSNIQYEYELNAQFEDVLSLMFTILNKKMALQSKLSQIEKQKLLLDICGYIQAFNLKGKKLKLFHINLLSFSENNIFLVKSINEFAIDSQFILNNAREIIKILPSVDSILDRIRLLIVYCNFLIMEQKSVNDISRILENVTQVVYSLFMSGPNFISSILQDNVNVIAMFKDILEQIIKLMLNLNPPCSVLPLFVDGYLLLEQSIANSHTHVRKLVEPTNFNAFAIHDQIHNEFISKLKHYKEHDFAQKFAESFNLNSLLQNFDTTQMPNFDSISKQIPSTLSVQKLQSIGTDRLSCCLYQALFQKDYRLTNAYSRILYQNLFGSYCEEIKQIANTNITIAVTCNAKTKQYVQTQLISNEISTIYICQQMQKRIQSIVNASDVIRCIMQQLYDINYSQNLLQFVRQYYNSSDKICYYINILHTLYYLDQDCKVQCAVNQHESLNNYQQQPFKQFKVTIFNIEQQIGFTQVRNQTTIEKDIFDNICHVHPDQQLMVSKDPEIKQKFQVLINYFKNSFNLQQNKQPFCGNLLIKNSTTKDFVNLYLSQFIDYIGQCYAYNPIIIVSNISLALLPFSQMYNQPTVQYVSRFEFSVCQLSNKRCNQITSKVKLDLLNILHFIESQQKIIVGNQDNKENIDSTKHLHKQFNALKSIISEILCIYDCHGVQYTNSSESKGQSISNNEQQRCTTIISQVISNFALLPHALQLEIRNNFSNNDLVLLPFHSPLVPYGQTSIKRSTLKQIQRNTQTFDTQLLTSLTESQIQQLLLNKDRVNELLSLINSDKFVDVYNWYQSRLATSSVADCQQIRVANENNVVTAHQNMQKYQIDEQVDQLNSILPEQYQQITDQQSIQLLQKSIKLEKQNLNIFILCHLDIIEQTDIVFVLMRHKQPIIAIQQENYLELCSIICEVSKYLDELIVKKPHNWEQGVTIYQNQQLLVLIIAQMLRERCGGVVQVWNV